MDIQNDFQPSKGSSKLNALFNAGSLFESSSLTYNAPSDPKLNIIEKKDKMDLIIMKQVFAYKFENSSYQQVGMVGLSIVGSKPNKTYHILLYKTKENVVCKLKICEEFTLTLSDQNYASFYVDATNYSVTFASSNDLLEFASTLAEVRCDVAAPDAILTQDVRFSAEAIVPNGVNVTMRTRVHVLTQCGQRKLVQDTSEKDICIDMHTRKKWPWLIGCVGIRYNTLRVIVAPFNSSEPWKGLCSDGNLFLYIEFLNEVVISREVLPKLDETDNGRNSPLPFGVQGEDTGSEPEEEKIRKETLHKTGLLSRMTRLGQPILPFQGAVFAQRLDSDSDTGEVHQRDYRPKPRRRAAPLDREIVGPSKPELIVPQQLQPKSLLPHYQTANQFFLSDKLTQLSGATSTNNDVNLSLHFAEARSNNSEIRMGLAKVSDKLDIVLSQMQALSPKACTNVVDPNGLLLGLQKLLQENCALKESVELQKKKIEAQNDRIFKMLDRSLDGSVESKTPTDTIVIDDNVTKILNVANSNISTLETELNSSNSALREAIEKHQHLEQQLCVANQTILSLESDKKQLTSTIEDKDRQLEQQRVEYESVQLELAALEKENSDLRENERETCEKSQRELENMKHENQQLQMHLECKISQIKECNLKQAENQEGMKKLMNEVYKSLHSKFNSSEQFSGALIKEVAASVIRELTLDFLVRENTAIESTVEMISTSNLRKDNSPLTKISSLIKKSEPASALLNSTSVHGSPPFKEIWQQTEPPPLPCFDEDDGNDSAWN